MKISICQNALYAVAMVLSSIAATSRAQDPGVPMAAPAFGCSGCMDQPLTIAAVRGPAAEQPQVGVISTGGMTVALQENAEVVKNQPYEAQAITEIKQTLADGSHISQTTTATVARDTDGRTLRIQKLSTIGPWKSAADSQGDGPTLTTIFDPIAKTHTDYTSDTKVAHVVGMPPPLPGGPPGGAPEGFAVFPSGPVGEGMGPATFAVQGRADSPQPTSNPDLKTDSLGIKTIESISVTGTRTTNTIPVGAIGNDKDLVITRETWYSPDLKLVLQSTQRDPRFGETSYSLTKIQRSDPDPSLFQVPPGYSIDRVPVVVHNH